MYAIGSRQKPPLNPVRMAVGVCNNIRTASNGAIYLLSSSINSAKRNKFWQSLKGHSSEVSVFYGSLCNMHGIFHFSVMITFLVFICFGINWKSFILCQGNDRDWSWLFWSWQLTIWSISIWEIEESKGDKKQLQACVHWSNALAKLTNRQEMEADNDLWL